MSTTLSAYSSSDQVGPLSPASSSVSAGGVQIRIATWNLESLHRFFEALKIAVEGLEPANGAVGYKSDIDMQWTGNSVARETQDGPKTFPEMRSFDVTGGGSTLTNFTRAWERAVKGMGADVICVQEGLNHYRGALLSMCEIALQRLETKEDGRSARVRQDVIEFRRFFMDHFSDDGKGLFYGYDCAVCSARDAHSGLHSVDLYYDKIYQHEGTWANWHVYGRYGQITKRGEQTDQIHVRRDSPWKVIGRDVYVTSRPGTRIKFGGREYALVPRTLASVVLSRGSTKVVVGSTHVSGGRFEDVNGTTEVMKDERGSQVTTAESRIRILQESNGASASVLVGDFNASESYSMERSSADLKRQKEDMEKVDTSLPAGFWLDEGVQTKYREYIRAPFEAMKEWEFVTEGIPFPTCFYGTSVDHCWVHGLKATDTLVEIYRTTNHSDVVFPPWLFDKDKLSKVSSYLANYWLSLYDETKLSGAASGRFQLVSCFTQDKSPPLTDHSALVITAHIGHSASLITPPISLSTTSEPSSAGDAFSSTPTSSVPPIHSPLQRGRTMEWGGANRRTTSAGIRKGPDPQSQSFSTPRGGRA